MRFCPTPDDAARVPSFDGVPLDVDVTLPPAGEGPFPAIVMLHALAGDKVQLEADDAAGKRPGRVVSPADAASVRYHYNNIYFAERGFAVVNASSRGFGRSCGFRDSRGAGCERGWMHFLDQRYEARDVQHLLGLLVDQGVVRPDAIATTGVSMGGGIAVRLAYLRDRVRLQDGSFAAWESPAGIPMSISAAYARWGGGHGAANLLPNGRFLDVPGTPVDDTGPPGVLRSGAYGVLLAGAQLAGFVAPEGADPSADFAGWKRRLDLGEPYDTDVVAIIRELSEFHGAVSVPDARPAPLLIEAGFPDETVSVQDTLRIYRDIRERRGGDVALQLGDVGHSRGSAPLNTMRAFAERGSSFLIGRLGGGGALVPAPGSVQAWLQACPRGARASERLDAASWGGLHPRVLRLRGRHTATVSSNGGNPATARAFDATRVADACAEVPEERARGTSVYERVLRRNFVLAGLPLIDTHVRHSGSPGQLVARLWDVRRGTQRLVTRGVYRLESRQRGRIRFQLSGNAYRFRRGGKVKLELLGRDPGTFRPSNGRFEVTVSRLRLSLPGR